MTMPPDRPEYDDRSDGVDVGFELAMPFVCVTSVDGPFDDFAFSAGVQIGALDRRLASPGLFAHSELVYEPLEEQCDLVAMRHGFKMEILWRGDGWVHVGFNRQGLPPT